MTNLDPIVRVLREQLPELEILEYEPMRAHCHISFTISNFSITVSYVPLLLPANILFLF